MNHIILIILGIIAQFGRHSSDAAEPQEHYDARTMVIAQQMADAARGPEDLAALLVLYQRESHGARYVLNGCIGKPPKGTGNCDRGKARGPYGNHQKGCPEGFALPLGSVESHAVFAKCAARLWRGYVMRCGSVEGGFAMYATGNSCSWSGAASRARQHRKLVGVLRGKLTASGVVKGESK